MSRLLSLFALLCVIFVASTSAASGGGWSVVAPRLATILLDISCPAHNLCYTSGAENGLGAVILMSSNGGVNWTNQNTDALDSFSFLSLDMYNSDYGFTAGLSLGGKMKGSLYTTNGQIWNESTTKHLVAAFTDVGQISTTEMYQVGQWDNLKSGPGDGIQISTNGGVSFNSFNWNQTYDSRYGSFVTPLIGWVSGGDFPTASNSSDDIKHLTQHVSINRRTGAYDVHPAYATLSDYSPPPNNTFGAVIAQTTDGGNTWTTLYHRKGGDKYGFYFNQIQFVNVSLGWVIGEGVNHTTGNAYSFIWQTTNGGISWNTQLYVNGASFMSMEMLNATYGWVVGGVIQSALSMKGQFYLTTNGGQTWTLEGEIKDTLQAAVTVVDATEAYSTAITILEVCSVYAYSPQ